MLISHRVVNALLSQSSDFNVLHVGAHNAEEADLYNSLGASHVYWVEAQPELCAQLRDRLDASRNSVFEGVAWSVSGEHMTFRVTNNSQSSSLFQLKDHLDWHPNVAEVDNYDVVTTRLDELVPDVPYLLVTLDIQGAELQALKGLGQRLTECRVLYCEVNRAETYAGLDQIGPLDAWLADHGYRRLVTAWNPGTGWGDAIYVKNLSALVRGRAKAVAKLTQARRGVVARIAALRSRFKETTAR